MTGTPDAAAGGVLIVGAGPTGLTAAVELARRGLVAEVIDRADGASTLSRAVGILPRSLDLLAPSGVTARLLAEGVRLREMRLFLEQRRTLTIPLAGGDPDRGFVLALAQDRTEAALRDAFTALGGQVRYGVELVGVCPEDDGVVVELADGTELRHDHVIGADGARSAVREALGLEFIGHDLPETWSIADVDAAGWPHAGAFTVCARSGGRVAVVAPLERERFRVVSNTDDALATLPLPLAVGHVRRTSRFTISIRQVPEYVRGRVSLAGDAAHCHSPVGGRGMNLGIADAAELAARLVEDRLGGYSASRHADGAATIARSERLRRIMTARGRVPRAITATSFRVIDRLPPVKRAIARRLLG